MASENFYDETTTLGPVIEATTTPMPLTTILRDVALTTTPLTTTTTANLFEREHLAHNKITFEIPNHRDLEHIDSMHNFNTLLKRIGNAVTTYDASQFTFNKQQQQQYHHQQHQQEQMQQQFLTNAEISKSVVLDLADLKGNSDAGFDFSFGLERFFAGADMHSIINYLWIGVVTSLVILSIIFIVFSCYFYRKFREWKKCNKDIRAHFNGNGHNTNNNNNNSHNPNGSEIFYAHSGSMVGGSAGTYLGQLPDGRAGTTYYQIESPPCYTIATGLPSYDEALLHQHHHHHHKHHHKHQHAHQEQQHQNCFNYAFKYMYATPTPAPAPTPMPTAIHQGQQQHMDAAQTVNAQASSIPDGNFIRNWKKTPASTIDTVAATAPATSIDDEDKMLQYCCATMNTMNSLNNVDRKNSKITSNKSNKSNKKERQQRIKVSTLLLEQSPESAESPESPPPAYDVTTKNIASLRLSLGRGLGLGLSGNDMESTPMLLDVEKRDNAFNICMPDEILLIHKEINFDEKQQQQLQQQQQPPNTPEGTNECLRVTAGSEVATILSHTSESHIDDSLNDIVVVVA